jgi:hypothetical protein
MSVTVKLTKPIAGHSGLIKEITLREPRYREIMKFGEPFQRGFTRDGSVAYYVENIDVIRSYIEVLIQAPADALLLEQLETADTLRLKDAVLGFFTTAMSKQSEDTSTSSSSTSTSSISEPQPS